jgi:hypothetical protein
VAERVRRTKRDQATEAVLGTRLVDAVAAGASVVRAAEALGLTEREGYRIYHESIRRYYEENSAARELMVAREMRKLDLLERPMFKQALDGDQKAVDRVLAIMKARRDMLGLDAAAKVQVEIGRADDALAKIVQIVDGTAAAAQVQPLRRLELPEAG